jgi:hypothetical protein
VGEGANFKFDGIGLWIDVVQAGRTAAEAARATPGGSALLFSSRAKLTGYDANGKAQVYRYDAEADTLACLSCVPTQLPATSDDSLLTMSLGWGQDALPLSRYADVQNLRPDGKRAFFESDEGLVLEDTDGMRDVYEWEEDGVGSCRTPGGCVYLISSGTSAEPTYLYAVSESGDDVFIETSDLLLPSEDPDETPSIYDVRVNGGFAPPTGPAGECLGEACQPAAVAPNDPTPSSSSFEGKGNVANPDAPKARCPKGKVRKGKKQRCVTKKARHQQKAKKRSGAKGRSHR